ncbi:MAG TPA: NFACT family protein, partial [Armatimonadota bacterium]|nr:NFACT family protein [Armatimonadota bacterium]
MFFDAMMLARAVAEAEMCFVGARVQDPAQQRHDEMVLVFRRDLPANSLLISSSPQFGRVCLASRPKNKAQPQPFGLALRKHLRGARLTGVSQPGFDRIIRLEFEECDGFGKESTGTLIAEIMGKHGNIMLLDEHEVIISCAKHVPARMNRYRQIMEGEPYVPPPDFDKVDPREITAEALLARVEANPDLSLRDLVVKSCTGISKVLSAEILARFGDAPDDIEQLQPAQIDRLVA